MTAQVYTALVLLWFHACLIIARCPFNTCICGETYMICKDEPRVPGHPYQPTPIPELPVDLNSATVLSSGVLPTNITELYLTSSPISSIADDAFDQVALTLITVSFTNVSLTSIPNAFLRLKAIKYLTIIDTPIQNWNEPAMLNVAPFLETLSLTNVSLTSWPSWLSQCVHLIEMSISVNSVGNLPDDIFSSSWASLTSLSLGGLQITQLPRTMTLLTTLTSLDLSNNRLSNVTFLPSKSPLTLLSLNGNNLTNSAHLGDYVNLFAKSLTNLNLQNNKLTSFPNLKSLTRLTYLDLSMNRLFDPFNGVLPTSLDLANFSFNFFQRIPQALTPLQSLYEFELLSNSITQIFGSDFTPNVSYVDLQSNKITSLTASSFPKVSAISILVLDNNPLLSIERGTFKTLGTLATLNLRNTPLTRLPLALGDLRALTTLDVSGSPYLKCTCQEKALSTWVLSVPIYTFTGKCGLMGIHDFFTIFAPQCP